MCCSPWGSQRVGHDLTAEQQQQPSYTYTGYDYKMTCVAINRASLVAQLETYLCVTWLLILHWVSLGLVTWEGQGSE